ncbi:RF-1 domain-containing protein [Kockiozyma suomiensis]|uniref:RF-1 domain-containing protein n=1 Tax=Kockiozyma suomiensis TaxID=1337062 RepID=UPI00334301FE
MIPQSLLLPFTACVQSSILRCNILAYQRVQLSCSRVARRVLSSSSPWLKGPPPMPPRPSISEDEIEEVFIKGGGKGGQKINKTNSKVQLRHIPSGLIVSSQATRSREQNRKIARRKMAEELQYQNDPESSRRGKLIEKKQKSKRNQRKKSLKRARLREAERQGLPEQEKLLQPPCDSSHEIEPSESIYDDADQSELENDLRILREIEEEELQNSQSVQTDLVEDEYEVDYTETVDLLSDRNEKKKRR